MTREMDGSGNEDSSERAGKRFFARSSAARLLLIFVLCLLPLLYHASAAPDGPGPDFSALSQPPPQSYPFHNSGPVPVRPTRNMEEMRNLRFYFFHGFITAPMAFLILLLLISLIREQRKTEKLKALFNHHFQMTCLLDNKGRIQDANGRALGVIAIDNLQQIAGRDFWSAPWWIHSSIEAERVKAGVQKTISGDRVAFETTINNYDGRIVYVEISLRPIYGSKDSMIGIMAEMKDLTEIKDLRAESRILEEKLRQSRKLEALGNLAGGIAHDFNNILSAIMGNLEIAMMDLEPESNTASTISGALGACHRASNLVRRILAFARKSSFEREPTDLTWAVDEALWIIKSAIPSTIRLDVTTDSVGMVMADNTEIHQIVMNLCTNAVQAINGRQGTISINLERLETPETGEKALAMISVMDNGGGIPAEVLDRIFEPYFTTKAPGKGTGLGLSVVHGIVTSMNGTIGAESEPGRWTKFTIYLPLLDDEEEEDMAFSRVLQKRRREPQANWAGMRAGAQQASRGRALVVEDEEIVLQVLIKQLELLGFDVFSAGDPLVGLDIFLRTPEDWALVLTDFTMPGMTGDILTARIREKNPHVPVVICSGFTSRGDGISLEEVGADAILVKPIDLESLKKTVDKVTGEGEVQS